MKDIATQPATYGLNVEGQPGREVLLALSGRIALDNVNDLLTELRAFLERMSPAKLEVDLGQVEYLDSSGALALIFLEKEAQTRNIPFSFANASESTQRIMGLIDPETLDLSPLRQEEELNFFEQLGQGALGLLDEGYQVLSFFGKVLTSLISLFFRPRLIRWNEVLVYMQKTGVEAFPILGMMSLLMGLVLAFMSSFTLQEFGAIIYVAALVGVGFVRALGALLTGILMAGRSGSAFAAEIGTMQVNEEVDALEVMGFEPVRFLAVPKVLATMLVMPILTLYSIFFGLLGGFLVGVTVLDISIYTYINQTQNALEVFDIFYSLVEAVVYGMIIATIGCQRGFQVRGGAEEVGTATTSAVVAGLFLIIVAAAIFSILQQYIRPYLV
ncbi:MAG: MlaE family lipid ABC transporter permease subunit [Syntrophobacterales bacterium]|jgi:phospholipid/cholesterol/gamma-HCH transport system permease protein